MRTKDEIVNDLEALASMRKYHIIYDPQEQIDLFVELAECLLATESDPQICEAAERFLISWK